jgi:hypothetical protein
VKGDKGVKRGSRGKGGEMTQTLYAHMNKIKIKKNKNNTNTTHTKKTVAVECPALLIFANSGSPFFQE